MNGYPPPYPPPAQASTNGHRPSLSHHLSSDSPQMPPPAPPMPQNNSHTPMSPPRGIPPPGPPGVNGNMRGQMAGFPGARSPPGTKNTSHVPCKFFRQGNCQAGKACPFLHSTEPAGPCKYFAKGNCKYGMACANDHILPDGRRGNRHGYGMPGRNMAQNGRGAWQAGPEQMNPGSLLSMQQQQQQQQERQQYPAPPNGQRLTEQDLYPATAAPPINIPTIDATFTGASHPGSNYGSPPNDADARFGRSPMGRGLSVLDAPLPASFDSQGISNYARFAKQLGASVPARLPLDSSSPPSSLPRAQGNFESSTLRNLHNSVYPDEARSAAQVNGFLGSSPPQREVDESIGRRIMHSERYSALSRRGGMPLSSSVPVNGRPIPGRGLRGDDDWDENFAFEEEFVPKALHDDILTPQEQEKSARRLSSGRLGGDQLDEPSSLTHRRSLQALANAGSPAGSNSNSLVGSPSGGSRFGALFARQKTDDGISNGPNAFGHVGSPLRNSSLTMSSTANEAPKRPRPTSIGSGLSVESNADGWKGRSPPRSSGIGMISQQLQRTHVGDGPSTGTNGPSSTNRPSLSSSAQRMPSSGNVGMGRDRIDEEETEQEGLFDMEEVGIPVPETKPRKGGLKRLSGGAGWGFGLGNRSAAKVGLGESGINGP